MVYIKKLEVYGFKSFGFRNTTVSFERGLVAVTGPNGSGKSNILDAIMFAIGENSPKALRVDKFQSLFHDSQNSSHRLVRVVLTMDNSDRGIPVDSDTVTLTRQMEGVNGESQYLLSGKPVSKSAIMDILEVVLAAPNKLNIVQQGMITRISELNAEERRKIIEDIVGLSYFDEKKSEAMKQLDEADRRLEVAFARMGEIRKRVDELEAERNDQLRYDYLNSELKRFRASETSNKIRSLRRKLESAENSLRANSEKMSSLSGEIEQLKSEIDKLESEKSQFIQRADAASRSKANVASKVASAVHELERATAMRAENERRAGDIERRLGQLKKEESELASRLGREESEITSKVEGAEEKVHLLESLKGRLAGINSEIQTLSNDLARALKVRGRVEQRLNRVSLLKSNLEVSAARLEEKLKTAAFRRNSTSAAVQDLRARLDASKEKIASLHSSRESDSARLAKVSSELARLSTAKTSLERELVESNELVSKASGLATRFQERVNLVKNAMIEDSAIADIMKRKEEFGIVGLLHNVLKWDKNYERPVLAAGAEWMKSFVVPDVKSMIALASYAKQKKLPRLRIIPLDVASKFKSNRAAIPGDPNVIGTLSELVYSEYSGLPKFLFSDTLLVKNSTAAFLQAKQGYRAVSVDGELFEPAGISVSLDFGSKISNLTKAILVSESVESLRSMLDRLVQLLDKANFELRDLQSKISELHSEKVKLEIGLGNLEGRLDSEHLSLTQIEQGISSADIEDRTIVSEAATHALELEAIRRRLAMVAKLSARLAAKVEKSGDKGAIEQRLAQKNLERNRILTEADSAGLELSRAVTERDSVVQNIDSFRKQLANYNEERERLQQELERRTKAVLELGEHKQRIEGDLQKLRDEEQQIIDSSGEAYSVLQEYDRKIRSLTDAERKLAREHGGLERDSAVLRRDISATSAEEQRLVNDLSWLGYKDLQEEMEASTLVRELGDEVDRLKQRINLRADSTYTEVIEGYRGMSDRRNQLEMERNSIVSFIDQVVREKRDVFMEAFGKVDADIRGTFSDMTGGSAWLELENKDDIFAGGVMLLVQFPNKTVPRESTSLSGGEKTIVATVFLLALQSLKPSPFYLMDEVDAHLDAQNVERLSKILQQRSKDSQIIMVTLKDSTVARASLIYGVYARDGASHVVRYRNPDQVPLAQISSAEPKQ